MSEPTPENSPGSATTAEAAKAKQSLRDFKPEPFRDSSWEIVGNTGETTNGFQPLQLDVVNSPNASADPMFEDFDGGRPRSGKQMWHLPGTDSVTGSSRGVQGVGSAAATEEQLKEAHDQGYQAGFTAGQEAARSEIAAQQSAVQERQAQFNNEVKVEFEKLFTRVEQESVRLALEVAKRILETTAHAKPEYIIDVLHKAVHALGAATPHKVRVSPEDFEFIQVVGLPADLSAAELGIVYEADEKIKSGCMVETDFGEIDVQLDSMWQQVKESLFEVYDPSQGTKS